MGHVAQQLTLAADQTLQARAHAVEVGGQYAKLVAPRSQSRQAVLLVGGLPQVMHGHAQAAERAGDGQGHQQAEEGQHHQRNAQRTQRPDQALTVPGVQFGVRDAVNQQVRVGRLRAGVFDGQATPWQRVFTRMLASLPGSRPAREGAAHHGVAAFVQHLHVNVIAALAPLKKLLGSVCALGLIALGPFLGQI